MKPADLAQNIKSAINGQTDEMFDVKFAVTGSSSALVVVAKPKNPEEKSKRFSVVVKEM